MPIACKIFPNANAARGAMNAIKDTWVKPPLTFVNCTKPSILALTNAFLVLCTDAIELIDGKWALIADHPGWKNDTIEVSDIKVTSVMPSVEAEPIVEAVVKGGK